MAATRGSKLALMSQIPRPAQTPLGTPLICWLEIHVRGCGQVGQRVAVLRGGRFGVEAFVIASRVSASGEHYAPSRSGRLTTTTASSGRAAKI